MYLPENSRCHKLIQDVTTRWNSTFAMLNRLIELTAALHATSYDPRINKTADTVTQSLFSHEEQKIAEALHILLKSIK